MKRRGRKVLKPVRPNVGIEATYRKRIRRLVEAMSKSVERWIPAAWRENEPVLAQDELPSRDLQRAVRNLAKQWQKRFDDAAPKLADYFATAVEDRSRRQLQDILDEGGWSVKFSPTRAQRDVMQATIAENVSLIKSIPSQYFTQIEGMVMRSVTTGRDLQQLTRDLQAQYGVSRRRAALIARDQNNKATATLTAVRQRELGLTTAIWLHSGGGKHPRPKHVAASGTEYDVRKGLKIGDKGQYVLPGQEINCRCVSRTVVPGFE